MPKPYVAPDDYTKEVYVAIPMTPVVSNQIAAVGYSLERKTLAVTFTRGVGAVYHYPNFDPKWHADFLAAESLGKHFGQHIQGLPFKKFPPLAPVEGAQETAAPVAA